MTAELDMDNLDRALALQGDPGPTVRETLRAHLPRFDPESLDELLVTAVLLLGARYSGRSEFGIALRSEDRRERTVAAALAADVPLGSCRDEVAAAMRAGAGASSERPPVFGVDLGGSTDPIDGCRLVFSAAAAGTELTVTATGPSCGDDPGWNARALGHLVQVLRALSESPGTPVGELEILTPGEREQILGRFNRPLRGYRRDATLTELFAARAAAVPDHPAVVRGEETLTYAELEAGSEALAKVLQDKGVSPGDRVALLADKVPQLVVATLAILKCAAAYVPVDPAYPADRRDFLLRDCGASVLVTAGVPEPSGLAGITVVDADARGEVGTREAPSAAATDLAYVIYTSGSTGNPKGVAVPHRAVVRLAVGCDYLDLSPRTRMLQTGAVIFDITTMELWGPLLNGGTIVLAPEETLLDAAALGAEFKRQRVNTVWTIAPLLHFLVDQDPSIFAPLDVLIAGGDVLSGPHLAKLMAACPDLRVVNGYGPTENTTFSTTHRIAEPPTGRVPIGRPVPGSTAYVLDGYRRLQPVGLPGELYVGGDGVAAGYHGRPDLTARAFGEDPFDPGGRLYRTGDLTRWLDDGAVDFLGRIDNQVKIRGFRIEPSEVEQHLNRVPSVRQSAVTVRSRRGEKFLCAHYTADGDLTPERLRADLATTLPDYMMPAVLVRIEAMPLGFSGKIDRGVLARLALPETAAEGPAGSDLERAVAAMWCEALELERIGLDDELFGLGISSITTAVVAGRIQRELGVRVTAARLLAHPTVRQIAALVERDDAQGLPPIDPAPDRAVYPVSAQQRRIIVEQAKDERATHYNVPVRISLSEAPDTSRLAAALDALIERHESLRTGFVQMGSDYFQRIHEDVRCELDIMEDIGSWHPLPFDLARPPLVRAACSAPGGPDAVILDFHHSVVDGLSLDLLLQELDQLYRGEKLPETTLRYRDYAVWQHGEGGEAVRRTQRDFWLRVFAEPPAPLELPTDRPRSPVREFDGARIDFEFGPGRTEGLRELGRRCGATLFQTLTAAYFVFLHRITGQSDLTVGLPVDGRGVGELDPVVGMFANTLCMRARIDPDRPFTEFLRTVSDHAIEAFAHPDFQFDELVAGVGAARDYSRNPLFDTMIGYIEAEADEMRCLGGLARQDDSASAASMFDLNLQVSGIRDLTATWAYNTRLFHEGTAKSFVEVLLETVDALLADPETTIGALSVPESDPRALEDDLDATAHRGAVFDF